MESVVLKNGYMFFEEFQKIHPSDKGIKYCGRYKAIWEDFLKFIHLGNGTLTYKTKSGDIKLNRRSVIAWLAADEDKKTKKTYSALKNEELILKIQTAIKPKEEGGAKLGLPAEVKLNSGTTESKPSESKQVEKPTEKIETPEKERSNSSRRHSVNNLPPPDLSDAQIGIPEAYTRASIERANAQLKLKAEQGDVESQFLYAGQWDKASRDLFDQGYDCTEHFNEAIKWLTLIEKKHPEATLNMGLLIEYIKPFEGAFEAREIYEKHKDTNVLALFSLADLHDAMNQTSFVNSLSKEQKERVESVFSRVKAKQYFTEMVETDYKEAAKIWPVPFQSQFIKMAEENCAKTLFWLGTLYFHGSSKFEITKDAEKGKEFIEKAATLGNYDAKQSLQKIKELGL